MARNPARNLDHLLILTSPEETIVGWTLDGVEYRIPKTVPASAIIELTSSNSNAQGMMNYILECIVDDEQKVTFAKLKNRLGIDGLGGVIEEIVEKTTPFGEKKPND